MHKRIHARMQQHSFFTLHAPFQVVFLGLLRGGDALHSLLRQMHGLYVPAVVDNASWPEAVKADFTAQLHKFMANLTETVFEVKGKTILYIPAEHITVCVYVHVCGCGCVGGCGCVRACVFLYMRVGVDVGVRVCGCERACLRKQVTRGVKCRFHLLDCIQPVAHTLFPAFGAYWPCVVASRIPPP